MRTMYDLYANHGCAVCANASAPITRPPPERIARLAPARVAPLVTTSSTRITSHPATLPTTRVAAVLRERSAIDPDRRRMPGSRDGRRRVRPRRKTDGPAWRKISRYSIANRSATALASTPVTKHPDRRRRRADATGTTTTGLLPHAGNISTASIPVSARAIIPLIASSKYRSCTFFQCTITCFTVSAYVLNTHTGKGVVNSPSSTISCKYGVPSATDNHGPENNAVHERHSVSSHAPQPAHERGKIRSNSALNMTEVCQSAKTHGDTPVDKLS